MKRSSAILKNHTETLTPNYINLSTQIDSVECRPTDMDVSAGSDSQAWGGNSDQQTRVIMASNHRQKLHRDSPWNSFLGTCWPMPRSVSTLYAALGGRGVCETHGKGRPQLGLVGTHARRSRLAFPASHCRVRGSVLSTRWAYTRPGAVHVPYAGFVEKFKCR